VAKQNIFQFFLIFHSFFLVKLKAAMAPADALPSVHPSIICDFIEGKLFRVNETGGKEETNEMKATQPPLSLHVLADAKSKEYIDDMFHPLTLLVTKKDGRQTSQWEEVQRMYVKKSVDVDGTLHPLQGEKFSPLPDGRYFFVLFAGYSYLRKPMPNSENQKVIKFYVPSKEAVLKQERANTMADSKTWSMGLKLPNDWKPNFKFESCSDKKIKISWKTPCCDTNDYLRNKICSQSAATLRSVSVSHENNVALAELLEIRQIAIEYDLEYNTGSSIGNQSVEGKTEFMLEKDVHFFIDPREEYPYACDEHVKHVTVISSFRVKARACGTFYLSFKDQRSLSLFRLFFVSLLSSVIHAAPSFSPDTVYTLFSLSTTSSLPYSFNNSRCYW
jgi:hypothetical protein